MANGSWLMAANGNQQLASWQLAIGQLAISNWQLARSQSGLLLVLGLTLLIAKC
jgi:hypothetical protein